MRPQCWSTEGDFGRISPLDEKEIEKETIVCPQMVKLGIKHAIMREKECMLRLTTNQNCFKYCNNVDHLRYKLKLPPAFTKEQILEEKNNNSLKKQKLCICGEYFMTESTERNLCKKCLLESQISVETSFVKKKALKLELKSYLITRKRNQQRKEQRERKKLEKSA
jgi:hypothetical protein